ncbi:hypothetical protein FNE07_04070 [Helicobacter pylori]|nr:hypothetical protein FNE07_04070 [Helicobacter pylori]
MLKRAKSVTDRYALSASNDFKKHFKLSKIDKAKALNKKDPKRETGFLISYYQNPKYPFVSCPLLVYGCFSI